MPNKPALAIFSKAQIAAGVAVIKKERPDLWALWMELEDTNEEERYSQLMHEVRAQLRILGIMKSLNDYTEMTREIRLILRRERGLWTGIDFSETEIESSSKYLQNEKPELWYRWCDFEIANQHYGEIRPELVKSLRHRWPSFTEGKISWLLHEIRKGSQRRRWSLTQRLTRQRAS